MIIVGCSVADAGLDYVPLKCAKAVLLWTTPLVHGIGLYTVLCDKKVNKKRFSMDARFMAFQAFGWGVYALCVLSMSMLPAEDIVNVANAVMGFLAIVFITSSIISFESPVKRKSATKFCFQQTERYALLLNNYMNLLLVVAGVVLGGVAEYVYMYKVERNRTIVTGVGSMLMLISAVFNTYGLSGSLANAKGWQFYQPFVGGVWFVTFQILSWFTFGLGLLIQSGFIVATIVLEVQMFSGAMGLAGVLSVFAEIFMVISIMVYRVDEPNLSVVDKWSIQWKTLRQGIVVFTIANMPLSPCVVSIIPFLVTPGVSMREVFEFCLFSFSCMMLMVVAMSIAKIVMYRDSKTQIVYPYHPKYYTLVILVGCIPAVKTYLDRNSHRFCPTLVMTMVWYLYLTLSYQGMPEKSGIRFRPQLTMKRFAWIESISDYFSHKLIRMGPPLNPDTTYVMGFHPHGIVPVTVFWMQLTDQWKKCCPGIYGCPLTASALHQIPIVRDILQLFGGREVSRQAFADALSNKQSVILVPGGQSEMIESASGKNQLRIYTGHSGFIKLAIQAGASLLPILSLQETEIMDNIQRKPMQKWFVKNTGVPFPFFPYGVLCFPIPRPIHLPIIVGEPIALTKNKNPTDSEVAAVHEQYYAQIKTMFQKNKNIIPDWELILFDK